MIKEIKFPLPSIFDKISDLAKFYKPKSKYFQRFKTYDYIAFYRDYTLVEEFAEFCGIKADLAEEILTVFFDEIKKALLEGHSVTIFNLGKFHVDKRGVFWFLVNRVMKQKMNEVYGDKKNV